MADVACFCRSFSFDGRAGACPACGERDGGAGTGVSARPSVTGCGANPLNCEKTAQHGWTRVGVASGWSAIDLGCGPAEFSICSLTGQGRAA